MRKKVFIVLTFCCTSLVFADPVMHCDVVGRFLGDTVDDSIFYECDDDLNPQKLICPEGQVYMDYQERCEIMPPGWVSN